MKYKILTLMITLIFIIFGLGITYSLFHSSITFTSNDQKIAKFIFNTESLDQLQLPLIDLNPGNIEEYLFSVSNNTDGVLSNVSIEYQMTIKTYHLVPLIIELYKINAENEELILTCDETYTRDNQNKLVCNAPNQTMEYSLEKMDNYKLKVNFPSEYNDPAYADLVDYIDIEINSWQKIES